MNVVHQNTTLIDLLFIVRVYDVISLFRYFVISLFRYFVISVLVISSFNRSGIYIDHHSPLNLAGEDGFG